MIVQHAEVDVAVLDGRVELHRHFDVLERDDALPIARAAMMMLASTTF